jgi:hypothetical protein
MRLNGENRQLHGRQSGTLGPIISFIYNELTVSDQLGTKAAVIQTGFMRKEGKPWVFSRDSATS